MPPTKRRRGEGQFVAMELALKEGHPHVDRLADADDITELARHDRATLARFVALGRVFLLRAFVLQNGSGDGRLRDFTLDDIERMLRWRGKRGRLASILQTSKFIGVHRRTLFYPHWESTTTGYYAAKKAADRARHEEAREGARSGTVRGTSADSPGTVQSDLYSKKERLSADSPPESPPMGGALASARWEWLEKHHPTPRNRKASLRVLERMDEATWARAQGALLHWAKQGKPSNMARRYRISWGTDVWLVKEPFLAWKPEKLPEPPKAPETPSPPAADTALLMTLDQIRDPRTSEKKREHLIGWLQSNYPNETVPQIEAS